MESYEASKAVFTRVQSIDPEHATKIMGYILLNHDEKDMLRLAYGPQTLLLSLVSRAKFHLRLSSNTLHAPPLSPLSIPRLSNSSPSIWSPHHVSLSPNAQTPQSLNLSYINDDNNNNNNNVNVDYDYEYEYDYEYDYDGNDKPCLYYARGFCKNGSNCRFFHGDGDGDGDGDGGDDDDDDDCDYKDGIFRTKFAHHHQQQHRLAAAHLLANGVGLPFNNKFSFLHSDAQRSAAALMLSDDFHKLNRLRMARNEFGGLDCNPSSRQIYLTFPADSTFKEEDVSSYFNKFGPVQDVRIPYQQKRMFGFVTFVFPETVKIILAKGNPHFVCDSRVLVKPYKEKGKIPDKKFQHQFERGDFSCPSPSGLDCREPFDFQPGGRMMFSTQEMLLRKKLEEQADFQHALDLHERRLMNLKLMDLNHLNHQHHASVGSPILSPNITSEVSSIQTALSPSNGISLDQLEENKDSSANGVVDELIAEGVNACLNDINGDVLKKEGSSPNCEENEIFESSFDLGLPDNLFASPTKSSSNNRPAAFSPALLDFDNGISSSEPLSAKSSLSKSSLKSCFFEMPRISNGHEAIGM